MNIWKGFIDTRHLTEHPQSKIRLLDGRLIDAFPKPNGHEDIEGGSYELFISSAHLLYQNRDTILQDSRMLLAPLSIDNNMAYTGSYGFQNPVLGVYVEWWLNCKKSIILKPAGHFSLVCFMAGSPLSGMNLCLVVDENGVKEKVTIRPFSDLWQPFVSINMRYEPCKNVYEAYTFEKVLSILGQKQEQK